MSNWNTSLPSSSTSSPLSFFSPSLPLCNSHAELNCVWWLILWVQLTGLRDAQIGDKHHLGVCLCGCSQKSLAFELVNWVKQMALPNVRGNHSLLESPNKTKRQRKGKFTLCLNRDIHFSCPQTSVFLVLGISYSDQDLHNQPFDSQGFELGLNCTTDFSGSPTSRQQIVGLLNLYNHVRQFLQ